MLQTTATSGTHPTTSYGKTTGRALRVDGKTIPDAYLRRIELSGNDRAFLTKRDGRYQGMTWKDAHHQVLGIFQALRNAGIRKGDRVCIMSSSRVEWHLADIAILALGACTVPIYHSSSQEDVAYILEHCGAKLVFAEDPAQAAKLAAVYRGGKPAVPVVMFAGQPDEAKGITVRALAEFATLDDEAGAHEDFRKAVAAVGADDLASIVYTSGTTGRPKGAMLIHSNFLSELRSIIYEIELRRDDLTLTFLPFAHILGRVESLLGIFGGVTLAFAENLNTVPQNIQEVQPTLLVSVPRIYEKIFAKIQSEVEASPDLKKNIFKWAVAVGRDVARRRSMHEPIPPWLMLKFALADKLVFAKVRSKLGGRVRLSVSGGAPLSAELCEFLHACGVKVLEGYGLTETTAAVTVNRPDDFRFGTVGKPLADTEFRIAEDGEILVRGSVIFKGYYDYPEATAEVLSDDGWFATGDIGEFDSRGFLRITDRKKELIVTSGGKKVAPQKLENMIKASRFLSNGLVYGDKQKYLVALVTVNEAELCKWAKEQGIAYGSVDELCRHAQVESLVGQEIKSINGQLASFETIKKFRILSKDFTIESGELTPSMKLKRKVVTQRYKAIIDEMYA